jgi:hypothetical protein
MLNSVLISIGMCLNGGEPVDISKYILPHGGPKYDRPVLVDATRLPRPIQRTVSVAAEATASPLRADMIFGRDKGQPIEINSFDLDQ